MLIKKRNRVSHYREFTIKKVITYAINHGLLTMRSPLIYASYHGHIGSHSDVRCPWNCALHRPSASYVLLCKTFHSLHGVAHTIVAPDQMLAWICDHLVHAVERRPRCKAGRPRCKSLRPRCRDPGISQDFVNPGTICSHLRHTCVDLTMTRCCGGLCIELIRAIFDDHYM